MWLTTKMLCITAVLQQPNQKRMPITAKRLSHEQKHGAATEDICGSYHRGGAGIVQLKVCIATLFWNAEPHCAAVLLPALLL